MGFERESDARNMAAALKERLAKFRLTLHEEKIRLIMFGRYAVERRAVPRRSTFWDLRTSAINPETDASSSGVRLSGGA